MKIMGLLGGMSFESTVSYYQYINRSVRERLGGLHSARCLLYSVDFAEIEAAQRAGDWAKCARILTEAAQDLERANADFLVICTNTMHKVAPEIRSGVGIPLLHIGEVTAAALKNDGITCTALLGTRYTMEEDFYTKPLQAQGLHVLVPDAAERAIVNNIIFDELCQGRFLPESRARLMKIISELARAGAESVVLGCTELGLLIQAEDTSLPLYDTTALHAEAAVAVALGEAALPA